MEFIGREEEIKTLTDCYQMTEAYMIFGGIPYYMSLMEPHLSLYQNVDKIYFAEGAPLKNEFTNLYQSLYENADKLHSCN